MHDNHAVFRVFLFLLVHQIFQRDRIQVIDHLGIQVRPQVMRHAAAAMLMVGTVAVFLAAALGRIELLINRDDDVRHRHVLRLARQVVATARSAHRFDDFMAAQLAEQLLEVRQRDFLALADAGQRDRSLVLTQRQVNHCSHRKAAFCSQSHRVESPNLQKKASNIVGYSDVRSKYNKPE